MREVVKRATPEQEKEQKRQEAKKQMEEIEKLLAEFKELFPPRHGRTKPVYLTEADFRIIMDALTMHAAVINLLQIGGEK